MSSGRIQLIEHLWSVFHKGFKQLNELLKKRWQHREKKWRKESKTNNKGLRLFFETRTASGYVDQAERKCAFEIKRQ